EGRGTRPDHGQGGEGGDGDRRSDGRPRIQEEDRIFLQTRGTQGAQDGGLLSRRDVHGEGHHLLRAQGPRVVRVRGGDEDRDLSEREEADKGGGGLRRGRKARRPYAPRLTHSPTFDFATSS